MDRISDFEARLKANTSRLRSLEYFTGGSPRLALILYRVVSQSDVTEVRRALEINSNLAEAWNRRGLVLGWLERHEEALASLDHAIGIKPAIDPLWSVLTSDLGGTGFGRVEENFKVSIAIYDRLLKFKPDDSNVWNERGLALRSLGLYEEAITSFDRALEIDPNLSSQTGLESGAGVRRTIKR